MLDLSHTIVAKSDQLNADDLRPNGPLGGPITIRITGVTGNEDKEQPVTIHFDGDRGKPYKPGKSMRRVLINFWGKDGLEWVGRWLTLYCDPDVTFGKVKVGGIRISHMSHLDDGGEMALAVTKGAKRLYTVRRLNPPEGKSKAPAKSPAEQADLYIAAIRNPEVVGNLDQLREYQLDERRAAWLNGLREKHPEQHARIVEASSARYQELAGDGGSDAVDNDDDGFAGGGA